MSKWINNVLEILENKNKTGVYIKMKKDVTLKRDQVIFLKNYEADINELLERGKITQEDAEKKLSLTFIKMVGSLPPEKTEDVNF